jgi:hypothetical protein
MLKRSGIPDRELNRVAHQMNLLDLERLKRRGLDAPSLAGLEERSRAVQGWLHEGRRTVLASRDATLASSAHLRTDDVVNQINFASINFASMMTALKRFFEPSSGLHPTRRPQIMVQSTTLASLHVVVVVKAAHGLPIRQPSLESTVNPNTFTTTNQNARLINQALMDGGDEMGQCRPFVEVLFKDEVQRTETSMGGNPMFNQAITLPITPPEDGSDLTLTTVAEMTDKVTLNIFDEVVVTQGLGHAGSGGGSSGALSQGTSGRSRGSNTQSRNTSTYMERRLLGSVSMPLNAILRTGTFEGTLPLQVPLANLGYQVRRGMISMMNGTRREHVNTNQSPLLPWHLLFLS